MRGRLSERCWRLARKRDASGVMSGDANLPVFAPSYVWPIAELERFAAGPRGPFFCVIQVESLATFQRDLITNGLARRLVANGAGHFSLVGDEAESAEEALDWDIVHMEIDTGAPAFAMTTAHSGDDPDDIAWYVAPAYLMNGLQLILVLDPATTVATRVRSHIERAIAECLASGTG